MYVFGSLVTGDFDESVSDVDLLAVLDGELSPSALRRLDAVHADVVSRRPVWEDRVEVVYVGQDGLRGLRGSRYPIAKVGPGEPLGFREDDEGDAWVAEWFVVREFGVPLVGPAPSASIPPIAVDEVVARLRRDAATWPGWVPPGCHPGGQAYAVLTACRTLHLMAHRRITSKSRAAQWVRAELPEWADLVDEAFRMRALGGWTGDMDRERTLEFLRAAAALAAPPADG